MERSCKHFIASNIANTGNHGHSFLIYTNIEYIVLGNTAAIIPPTKPTVYKASPLPTNIKMKEIKPPIILASGTSTLSKE